ncbi:MAG: UDP-N-acetylmuramoyl-L-alanine--D-glutamate ligase [Oscillospiraceae bacterium]|jgi:UDP-N-acetylmuramoylalanine--D-glutamate ligase|nr:UDP-N-acetylmuramoyl-L-alanine--D-glutamate ligase [Oscillospiraceae bacterium]
MLDSIKQFFHGKKTLILGYGREGQSSAKLLDSIGARYTVLDPVGETIAEELLENHDIILKSPGIPRLYAKMPEQYLGKVTCQADLLVWFAEMPVIGVTGTKGKSTTSSLVYEILRALGENVTLLGNIGVPPLDVLFAENTPDVIVCELSCHQLEFMRHSPDIAVLLNVFPEHLDHYRDFDAYKAAKENIFKYQKHDDVILRPYLDNYAKVKYNSCLRGEHNYNNITTALYAVREYFRKQGKSYDENTAITVAEQFTGLPHRLELFHTDGTGREFVNDSISTIPQAVIQALSAYPDTDCLILGGMERNIPYDDLYAFLKSYSALETLILVPDTGLRIAKEMPEISARTIFTKDVRHAAEKAVQYAKKRVIFSPAAASYGFFKNFEERGDFFKTTILSLLKELK